MNAFELGRQMAKQAAVGDITAEGRSDHQVPAWMRGHSQEELSGVLTPPRPMPTFAPKWLDSVKNMFAPPSPEVRAAAGYSALQSLPHRGEVSPANKQKLMSTLRGTSADVMTKLHKPLQSFSQAVHRPSTTVDDVTRNVRRVITPATIPLEMARNAVAMDPDVQARLATGVLQSKNPEQSAYQAARAAHATTKYMDPALNIASGAAFYRAPYGALSAGVRATGLSKPMPGTASAVRRFLPRAGRLGGLGMMLTGATQAGYRALNDDPQEQAREQASNAAYK